jgi:hypothetical protein
MQGDLFNIRPTKPLPREEPEVPHMTLRLGGLVRVYGKREGRVVYNGPADKTFLKRSVNWLNDELMDHYLYLKKLGVVPHRNQGVLIDHGESIQDPAWRFSTCRTVNLEVIDG